MPMDGEGARRRIRAGSTERRTGRKPTRAGTKVGRGKEAGLTRKEKRGGRRGELYNTSENSSGSDDGDDSGNSSNSNDDNDDPSASCQMVERLGR